jgi:hypothetical protein
MTTEIIICFHCGRGIVRDENDEREVSYVHRYTGDPQCIDPVSGALLPTWAIPKVKKDK